MHASVQARDVLIHSLLTRLSVPPGLSVCLLPPGCVGLTGTNARPSIAPTYGEQLTTPT